MHVVNFLDVTFDLSTGKFKPYRKPNDDPIYINKHSNHPPCITRQLPTAINKRISLLSSDEQTFQQAAPVYQNALRHGNYKHKLDYMQHTPQQQTRRNRQRNVIWFNPPFSKSVRTNVGLIYRGLIYRGLQHSMVHYQTRPSKTNRLKELQIMPRRKTDDHERPPQEHFE